MLNYPNISRVALEIGPISIYWYGVLYLVSFVVAWWLTKKRALRLGYCWENEIISDFIFCCALGVIVGGRLGYVLFYHFRLLVECPWFVFKFWEGGMSFHGGLIGVIISLAIFARRMHFSLVEMFDFAAPLTPLGIALGRIGNFINSELWGRITEVSWGIVFPNGGDLPRHPSQLYEAFLEGILFFVVLWWYSSKVRPNGMICGLFLCYYGVVRFFCEFFREPDLHIGFVAFGWLTVGQALSFPLIIIGFCSILFFRKKY